MVVRTEPREELWFDITNVQVDVDRSWAVVLFEAVVGILTAGIAALVVESFVSMVHNNVVGQIASSQTASTNRVHRFQPIEGRTRSYRQDRSVRVS